MLTTSNLRSILEMRYDQIAEYFTSLSLQQIGFAESLTLGVKTSSTASYHDVFELSDSHQAAENVCSLYCCGLLHKNKCIKMSVPTLHLKNVLVFPFTCQPCSFSYFVWPAWTTRCQQLIHSVHVVCTSINIWYCMCHIRFTLHVYDFHMGRWKGRLWSTARQEPDTVKETTEHFPVVFLVTNSRYFKPRHNIFHSL